jgi:ABC-2 type transport system permease protein
MLLHFFSFELKYRFHRVSTYVYFAALFFMAFFSVSASDFGPIGTGKIDLNGPYAIADILVQLGSFGIFIVSAIFGMSALRDFQEDTYQLIFTKPISKLAYLGGRWAGSLVITILIFSGLILGAMAGSLVPWADHTRIQPITLWFYLQPFISFTCVQIFFLGSLFFTVAALTRRIIVVYLQGVVLFALYLIGAVSVLNTRSLETFWPSVFDPLGLVLFFTVTRYWTVVEKNTQLMHWSGVFLYNRALWAGIGVLALAALFAFFPMSAELLTARYSKGKKAQKKLAQAVEEDVEPIRHRRSVTLPKVSQTFGARATAAQLTTLTRLRFLNIIRDIPFGAIALVMIVLVVLNGRQAGRSGDWNVWPVTYLMTEVVTGSSSLFLFIVSTLYAGELIWRERDVRFQQIHDSLPVPGWVNWCSQVLALSGVELILITVVMLCGIAVQASQGYFHFELAVYFKQLYLVYFTQILMFILLALFAQTIVSNKFMGHGIVIGFFVLIPVLYRYGIENRLYLFGETTPYIYSDMNGFGHFVPALFWSTAYWLACGFLLGVFSIALARRGSDLSWASRFRDVKGRLVPLLPFAALCFAVFAASGIWFYYNAHVLNDFKTAKDDRKRQAAYERTYKKYERLPQPKIIAVDTAVDVFPERRSFSATGYYLLVNHAGQPISDVHVTDGNKSLDDLHFDRTSQLVTNDKELRYRIYHLEKPLLPNETARMDFRVSYTTHGFSDGHERPEFAYNGTFFDRGYFPGIGYDNGGELTDPVRRREEHLPLLEEMAPPGDPYYKNINLFTADSEWITFHATVSTSPDQVVLSPGYLKRQWMQNERRYFEYSMGDVKINNFFSFISGRYAVKRDKWKDVNLEIYYHPGHEYDLDRMMQSAKNGLAYYEKNFGPYQFSQFRVLEFPRYRGFAQSFPNTVPYSEQLGFIAHVAKPEDLDEVFYVTAHELGHQWWGHQLIGSMTQGSNMMSETLAQYSALMVVEKEYGPDHIRKFLKHELDAYLRGRGGETRREPPLVLVQREPYVWYNKGSLVMYALRDYIGEDKVNSALRSFLAKNRYASGPFPDTRGFVAALRDVTPPDMQYLITDLFETITLFDNKADSATYTETPDHKYKVELTVDARKLRADGLGKETELALNDLVDIGVFSGSGENQTPLYLQKQRISQTKSKIQIVVDKKPDRAGIDPYNKLIDRNPEDNSMVVSKR